MPSNKNLNVAFDKINKFDHLQNLERKNSKMMKSAMAYEYNVLPEKTNQKSKLDDIIETRIEEANENQRQFEIMRHE